jgi:hypothetical protein
MTLGFIHSRSMRTLGAFTALVLCLCVVLEMLGVPATMWNASSLLDRFDSSLFEDPLIPPAIPRLNSPFLIAVLEVVQQRAHIPVLALYLFHPPCFA